MRGGLKLQSPSKTWYLILSSQFCGVFFLQEDLSNCINFRLYKPGAPLNLNLYAQPEP